MKHTKQARRAARRRWLARNDSARREVDAWLRLFELLTEHGAELVTW